ncbi:IS1595 family transposase [Acinetobacter guillouiae]|uniref:IS1595 family transposase n=1 Tax=Acinetobacter TaxID=469 RepID=UPI0038912B6F
MDVTKDLDVIKQLFSNLSEHDKRAFLLSVSVQDNIKKVIQPKKISQCLHCESTHFVKNGKENNNQRYLCRSCKKSFVEHTGTILYKTHKNMDVWDKYIECFLEKYSIRKCARICEINIATAFAWRHKILDALQKMMDEVELYGVVQADETYTTVSYKGNHKHFNLPRPSHHRGTKATKRGISKEQVCVTCSVNLSGLSIAKISNLGRPTLSDLQKVLDGKIKTESVFVTDSLRPYQKLSNDMHLNHIRIDTNKRSKGIFNIQTINNYHSRLKDMIINIFKGVATKYLNNYLVYHNFVNFSKDTIQNKHSILIEFIRNTICSSKFIDISKRPPIPI